MNQELRIMDRQTIRREAFKTKSARILRGEASR